MSKRPRIAHLTGPTATIQNSPPLVTSNKARAKYGLSLRTDTGDGDIPPETRSRDFFAYRPYHLGEAPPRPALARLTNAARRVFDRDRKSTRLNSSHRIRSRMPSSA